MCLSTGVHGDMVNEVNALSAIVSPDEALALGMAIAASKRTRRGQIPVNAADYAGVANGSTLYRIERMFNGAKGVCVNAQKRRHNPTLSAVCFDSLAVDAYPPFSVTGRIPGDAQTRAAPRAT